MTGTKRAYAGKLGPWARGGCRGNRYLDMGLQGRPDYRRILQVEPEGGKWYWLEVRLEDGRRVVRWCGCNTYEVALYEVGGMMDEKLYMYRGEVDTVIAFDPVDAKLVVHEQSCCDLDEIDDRFEQVNPDTEIEVFYPDAAMILREEFVFIPKNAKVVVRAPAADWIASHGRGVLASTEW